jgi:3-hydroxyisobutyrate dehydrogenase-like beta-hydroxyacid dehydrogenase
MRIGFVGAGRIGRPMVDRLVAAGHQVQVLARSESSTQSLAAGGATPVSDLKQVAAGADAVAVCVYADGQVRELCIEGGLIDAMEVGSVLIVHTTGSPRTAQLLAERGADRDVLVVDAPISGGPHDVAAGNVTLFVGGSEAGLERARPVLTTYGDPLLLFGPVGAGQQVKLLNNAVFAANIGLLGQAVALAAQLGVDEADMLRGLVNGSAASRALSGVAARGSVSGFAESVQEFLGKDVAVVREVVSELGADLGVLGQAHTVLDGLLATPRG